MQPDTERTKFQKIYENIIASLKLIIPVLILIITGKFIYDFLNSKEFIQLKFRNLKVQKWYRSKNDKPKKSLKNPLTDSEIDDELAKLDK